MKKVSDLVSHFAVGHNFGPVGEAISNVVAQTGAQCSIKVCEHFTPFTVCITFGMYNHLHLLQEAVSKEVKRIHRTPFYTDREGSRLTDEEWQLFQNVMFLKSVTLKVTQPQETIKSCLVEVCAPHSWVLVSK